MGLLNVGEDCSYLTSNVTVSGNAACVPHNLHFNEHRFYVYYSPCFHKRVSAVKGGSRAVV